MRRVAPSAGLSPKLIKHFAIGTVSVTALLALFASDADWGARAQLDAAADQNQLATTEAEKLGKKRVIAKLKIRRDSGGGMSMGGDSGGGGGGGGLDPEPPSDYTATPQTAGLTQAELARAAAGQGRERYKGQPKQEIKRKPTEEELAAMLEASRQRSGSTSSDD